MARLAWRAHARLRPGIAVCPQPFRGVHVRGRRHGLDGERLRLQRRVWLRPPRPEQSVPLRGQPRLPERQARDHLLARLQRQRGDGQSLIPQPGERDRDRRRPRGRRRKPAPRLCRPLRSQRRARQRGHIQHGRDHRPGRERKHGCIERAGGQPRGHPRIGRGDRHAR